MKDLRNAIRITVAVYITSNALNSPQTAALFKKIFILEAVAPNWNNFYTSYLLEFSTKGKLTRILLLIIYFCEMWEISTDVNISKMDWIFKLSHLKSEITKKYVVYILIYLCASKIKKLFALPALPNSGTCLISSGNSHQHFQTSK